MQTGCIRPPLCGSMVHLTGAGACKYCYILRPDTLCIKEERGIYFICLSDFCWKQWYWSTTYLWKGKSIWFPYCYNCLVLKSWITKGFKWETYLRMSEVEWFISTSENVCKLKQIRSSVPTLAKINGFAGCLCCCRHHSSEIATPH